MRKMLITILMAAIAAGCTSTRDTADTAATPEPQAEVVPAAAPVVEENPLLQPWVGPYGGVPPFDKVRVEDFKPALETAMAENLAEIDRIANDPAPPTFENTIAAITATRTTTTRTSPRS